MYVPCRVKRNLRDRVMILSYCVDSLIFLTGWPKSVEAIAFVQTTSHILDGNNLLSLHNHSLLYETPWLNSYIVFFSLSHIAAPTQRQRQQQEKFVRPRSAGSLPATTYKNRNVLKSACLVTSLRTRQPHEATTCSVCLTRTSNYVNFY